MDLIERLRGIIGDNHCLTDAALRAGYETDWKRRFSGMALAVVRPGRPTETVSAYSTSDISVRQSSFCVLRGPDLTSS